LLDLLKQRRGGRILTVERRYIAEMLVARIEKNVMLDACRWLDACLYQVAFSALPYAGSDRAFRAHIKPRSHTHDRRFQLARIDLQCHFDIANPGHL
jgi:hypothetical protein